MSDEKPARAAAVDPVTRFVRSLDGDFYTLREIANHLGVSVNSMRTLARKHPAELGPSFAVMFGRLKVFLYTAEDLDRVVEHQQRRKAIHPDLDDLAAGPGRPVLWSNEENRRRHQGHSAVYYWRRRAEVLHAAGKPEQARSAAERAAGIAEAMKAEQAQRLEERATRRAA